VLVPGEDVVRGGLALDHATAEVRTHGTTALFKLYIINGEEVFSFYPLVEHSVTIKGEPVPIFDVMGKDATLFHFAVSDDEASMSTAYVEEAPTWFDSVWNTGSACGSWARKPTTWCSARRCTRTARMCLRLLSPMLLVGSGGSWRAVLGVPNGRTCCP
jgi:hypothetical protein